MSLVSASDVEAGDPKNVGGLTNHLLKTAENLKEEEEELKKKHETFQALIEQKREKIKRMEIDKSKLDVELMTLKVRDKAYQKEHSNLRNAITVVRYKIDKIKESITLLKASDLKDLENFEKAVDEISQKFRSGPALYNRPSLMAKLEKEKELMRVLAKNLEEEKQKYADFNRERGLRARTDDKEDLLECILPGSELHSLLEMERNLDQVISEMKMAPLKLSNQEELLQDVNRKIQDASSSLAALKNRRTELV